MYFINLCLLSLSILNVSILFILNFYLITPRLNNINITKLKAKNLQVCILLCENILHLACWVKISANILKYFSYFSLKIR